MRIKTAILLTIVIVSLMLSAGCTYPASQPPTTAAPTEVSTTEPMESPATTPASEIPTPEIPAKTASPTPAVIGVNDIITMDDTLYFVYSQDPRIFYLKEIVYNDNRDGFLYAGPIRNTIKQPIGFVNANARYITHLDPYGSDAVKTNTTSSKPK